MVTTAWSIMNGWFTTAHRRRFTYTEPRYTANARTGFAWSDAYIAVTTTIIPVCTAHDDITATVTTSVTVTCGSTVYRRGATVTATTTMVDGTATVTIAAITGNTRGVGNV